MCKSHSTSSLASQHQRQIFSSVFQIGIQSERLAEKPAGLFPAPQLEQGRAHVREYLRLGWGQSQRSFQELVRLLRISESEADSAQQMPVGR